MNSDLHSESVLSLEERGALKVEDGNHGEYRPRKNEFVASGTSFIRAADIKEGNVVFNGAECINDTALGRIRKGIGHPGDVLITHKGTIGKVGLVGENSPSFVCSPQTTFWRVTDSSILDRDFLYAYMRSSQFQSLFRVYGGETDMAPYVSLTSQRSLVLSFPDIDTQRSIGRVVRSFDNKIKLNRKTNETLEGIAKALFKSWFVDFGPARAKAEGRPNGLPDEISMLFPNSFEESELGEIPSGWGCRQLRELIESIKDRQEDRLLEEFSATVTGIEARDERFKKNLAKSSNKNRVAHEGDLVFGLSRRVINFGRMPRSIGAFSPVYEVFRSLPGAPISTKFIEEQIRQRMYEFMIILKPAAREGQAIDREILLSQSVPIPPGKVIAAFEALADLVESRIKVLTENMNVLEQMRDALLPRLISGELRVPDAEKMLEEVGI